MMFVRIPVSSWWHYGYDTVLMNGGVQGEYMSDELYMGNGCTWEIVCWSYKDLSFGHTIVEICKTSCFEQDLQEVVIQ